MNYNIIILVQMNWEGSKIFKNNQKNTWKDFLKIEKSRYPILIF